ncbi:hypothetical protein Hanom_Chr06g00502851 [Helianthus anomalus]
MWFQFSNRSTQSFASVNPFRARNCWLFSNHLHTKRLHFRSLTTSRISSKHLRLICRRVYGVGHWNTEIRKRDASRGKYVGI